jgi:hypothetical protein
VAITQKFLGIQLQCARCHDHPFDKWSQLDFYGMAAFVSRLQVVGVGKKGKFTAYAIGEKNLGDVLFTGPVTQDEVGKKGEPVKPKTSKKIATSPAGKFRRNRSFHAKINWPTGSPIATTRTSRGRPPIGFGVSFWARESFTRWITSVPKTRPAIRNCSMRWRSR